MTDDLKEQFCAAVSEGKLVILPTDTVYGIGSDPWDPEAVELLLGAKGRGETMPPPVLVPNVSTLLELGLFKSDTHRDHVRRMAERFWPGALTLVVKAARKFGWDTTLKGDTVALRMPDHPLTLSLLAASGPLAVTSANRTGESPAETVDKAREVFGDEVAVYVDGGHSQIGVPSTIVDVTGEQIRVLRQGTVGLEQLLDV